MNDIKEAFSDARNVARYAEGPPRFVPGYSGLQQMARVLIAERVSDDARILILGAGGGLEMRAFAEAQSGWSFDGVDPSAEMLELARDTMGPFASHARLHHGLIGDAPDSLFDAATCLLTLHFLSPAERRSTVAEVLRRLKPGAPFVVAHFSIPQGEGKREQWLSRYASFVIASGVDSDSAKQAKEGVDSHLHILTPEQDEAILRDAGFSNVTMFYTGFTFRGWVAYA